MGVLEALVLLSVGLLCGIVSTMCDVLLVGSASFLSHFALWVLLNTLLATHMESRAKAMWWSVPFNLGFIEGYFITTVASYESYAKSLVVPLAAVAVLSPFLVNALWTAKREKGHFGQALSVALVCATLCTSFVINGELALFDWVVCAIVALELLVVPTRRLSIRPARNRDTQVLDVPGREPEGDAPEDEGAPREATRRRGRLGARAEDGGRRRQKAERAAEPAPEREDVPAEEERRAPRPTKRTGSGIASRVMSISSRRRRRAAEQDERDREREQRLRESSRRRMRREEEAALGSEMAYDEGYDGYVSTLGNVRSARPSTRSRR